MNISAERLLAVFAHPDDESFRPGGTLALLARNGVHVQVVTATRGQAGSCGDPPLCSLSELPALRESELSCACATLGLQPPILLDHQDGQLAVADPELLVEEILAIVREFHPQIMLTYGGDGISGHPDHIAIGLAAVEAFRRADGVSLLYTLAVPSSLADRLDMKQIHSVSDEAVTLAVDVSSVWDIKMAAIHCLRTQLGESPILVYPAKNNTSFWASSIFALSLTIPPLMVFILIYWTGWRIKWR